MDTDSQQTVAAQVLAALEANKLDLPTLPDVALKIRLALDDGNVSADQLVNLLSADPVFSTAIINAANCAAYSTGQPVVNLRNAIVRLGYRMLRNLVLTITLTKMFQADNPAINERLKKLWERSREVAANSYVLAMRQKSLQSEQAMLAGLLHNIGDLPLYLYADRCEPRLDQETLDDLTRQFSSLVGAKLLQNWHFPTEFIDVITDHKNLQRASNSELADYVDVVTVACLQMHDTVDTVPWENIPAAKRLGFSPIECKNFLFTYEEQLAQIHAMLGIGKAKPEEDAPPASTEMKPSQPVAGMAKRPAQKTGLFEKIRNFFK